MDRGAWRAKIYGVTKSWTWLSDKHFHFHLNQKGRIFMNGIFFLLFLISTYSLGNDYETSWRPSSQEAGGKGTITARRLSSSLKCEVKGDYRNPDEMFGWYHRTCVWVNSRTWWRQGSLTCCSPRGCKESDTTEQLINNSCQWTGPLNRRESQKPQMMRIRILFSWPSTPETWADTTLKGASWAELPQGIKSQVQLLQLKLYFVTGSWNILDVRETPNTFSAKSNKMFHCSWTSWNPKCIGWLPSQMTGPLLSSYFIQLSTRLLPGFIFSTHTVLWAECLCFP